MEDRENNAGDAPPWYCAGNLANTRATRGRSQPGRIDPSPTRRGLKLGFGPQVLSEREHSVMLCTVAVDAGRPSRIGRAAGASQPNLGRPFQFTCMHTTAHFRVVDPESACLHAQEAI
jgi:hypothetical protein